MKEISDKLVRLENALSFLIKRSFDHAAPTDWDSDALAKRERETVDRIFRTGSQYLADDPEHKG